MKADRDRAYQIEALKGELMEIAESRLVAAENHDAFLRIIDLLHQSQRRKIGEEILLGHLTAEEGRSRASDLEIAIRGRRDQAIEADDELIVYLNHRTYRIRERLREVREEQNEQVAVGTC
ncbi:MAG: hypothetical protein KJ970_09960 [Candidatus Eisenbacteria bacterium]|uniref:Uncharacterized protein n=1 Tax=Eiseniibacteriota bacterium TaxID=2212470 RepID=A0A948RXA3_UNCEI|nr:hypothetical protein [Candidatus Eisenbacteria bacterium]MBU2691243.1 hypothetical protein [Candidatus Eisenbacteria bacterium]